MEDVQSLTIPIKGSDQVVEVGLEDLAEDPSDILDILKAELATLDLWQQFAVRIASIYIGYCNYVFR
jgi:hypothetical protein